MDEGARTRVLAIDTATDAVIAGVVELEAGGAEWPAVLAEVTVTDQRRHAEVLTTLIAQVLREAGLAGSDLDAVVVGCGPGPFTGLRVGMATGAAYADALRLPVYPVGTLDAIAAQTRRSAGAPGADVLVVTDARRREVYWARYRGARRVAGPGVCAPAELAVAPEGQGAGLVAGAPGFTGRFGGEVSATVYPSAAALVDAAGVAAGTAPGPLTPLYLRRPDAVELKDQKRKSLLPETGKP